jgi:hypothetical protein
MERTCKFCNATIHEEDWEGREFFELNWAADVPGTREDRMRCAGSPTYHDPR